MSDIGDAIQAKCLAFGNRINKLNHNLLAEASKKEDVRRTPGMEPFYPVNDERNQNLYKQYEALAQKESNIIFGGRLAEYK